MSGQVLVSRTDFESVVEYANGGSMKIGGFVEQALLCKAHRIVRRSKVSQAACTGLWRMLEADHARRTARPVRCAA